MYNSNSTKPNTLKLNIFFSGVYFPTFQNGQFTAPSFSSNLLLSPPTTFLAAESASYFMSEREAIRRLSFSSSTLMNVSVSSLFLQGNSTSAPIQSHHFQLSSERHPFCLLKINSSKVNHINVKNTFTSPYL